MFTSAHHAIGSQRAAIGQMAYAVAPSRRGLVSVAGGCNLRGEAGARTTKYRPQFEFPRGVSRGCVARAFAPSASCSQESRQSRDFASLPRPIPRLPVRASLRGATRWEQGASCRVLLDRFVDGESGRAWRVTFNTLGRPPRPYAKRRMKFLFPVSLRDQLERDAMRWRSWRKGRSTARNNTVATAYTQSSTPMRAAAEVSAMSWLAQNCSTKWMTSF
jgi:hypothetical protein